MGIWWEIMSIRKVELVNKEYYHVFNRGVERRDIFIDSEDLQFFFNGLLIFNKVDTSPFTQSPEKFVDIVAYCLLPNHFHLLLRQVSDEGISRFMQKLCTSYAKFFNKKYKRNGSLFQGRFKANHLNGEYALPTLASYVNLNYKHHKIDRQTRMVKSSIFEYLDMEMGRRICSENEINNILNEVGGLEEYKKYATNASISFADNKNINLENEDFSF
ncbi:transposase [endosymbiont of Bathymodiolus septemdierum str. Myojin knoll]|uniref:Transposase n=2 Tax=sulfur-oxidizing symbionts TaxID=32036 RepID=A0A0N7KBH3_9GAMM|nr:transposase [endosymbiont of Bathymodiolus septemdierum str. Myojin knoll]